MKSSSHHAKMSEGSPISVVSSSPNTSKLSCSSTSSSVKSSTHSGTSKDSPISVASTSSAARSSTCTGTSKDSPISVASTHGSPDCNDYPTTSNSMSPDSETSSSPGKDTGDKTASSFHVPEPPEDVSVLFVDEASDYQESGGRERSLIKDRQLSTRVEEMRRSMAGLKFTSSPVLRSPDDLSQERRNEGEGGSPFRAEVKSDSFSSPSSEANPTLLYSCGSGGEGESERSTSLSKGKPNSFSSLSNEANPTVLYPPLGSGDEEGEERSTSLSRVNDNSPSLSGEASSKSSPQSGHSSETGSEGDSENRVGGCSDGPGSAGVAQGNGSSSEAGATRKEKEKERKAKEEEEEEDERSAKPEPQFKVGHQYRTVQRQLMQNEVSCTYLIIIHVPNCKFSIRRH